MNGLLIYSAEGRKWRVAVAMTVLLLGAGMLIWFAADIYQNLGKNPADGYQGQLAPWSDRAMISAFLAVFAILLLIGTWLYLTLYIRKMVDCGNGEVCIYFFVPISLCIRTEDVVKTRAFDGEYYSSSAPNVQAPFSFIYLQQRKLPLIFDAQGKILDRRSLRQFIPSL